MPWEEVLAEVRRKREELGNGEIWYRGHASAAWELRPAIVRARRGREREIELYDMFVRHAPRVLRERRDTDWENLFEMQHYGFPTRLLDWTEAFAVALFFALSEEHEQSTIFLLEPRRLNAASGLDRLVVTEKVAPDDLHATIFSDPEPNHLPLAVKAPFQNDRMFAQRAVFTIFRNDSRPLDQSCPDAVRRVDFGADARPGAIEFLQMANVDWRSVFPDISGFAQYVRKSLPID